MASSDEDESSEDDRRTKKGKRRVTSSKHRGHGDGEDSGGDGEHDLTFEQAQRAALINERIKHGDRRKMYKEKAYRRENQDSIAASIAEEMEQCRLADESLQFMSITLERANELYAKTELNADGKELARDSRILNENAKLLASKTALIMAGRMKQFSCKDFILNHKRIAQENKKKTRLRERENRALNTNYLFQLKEGVDYSADTHEEEGDNLDIKAITHDQWIEIGVSSNFVLPSVAGVSYLKPLLKIDEPQEPTAKKVKKERAKKDEREPEVVIKQTSAEHAKDELTVSKELDNVLRCLKVALKKNNGKLNYYKFIINPNSFDRTVQNMFHTSFLIKDCKAKFDFDQEGHPCLYGLTHHDKESLAEAEKIGASTLQMITFIDMPLWEGFIKYLQITEALIAPLKEENGD